MSPEVVKWILGAMGSAVVVVGGLVAWLARLAYSIGSSARGIEEMRGELADMKRHADQVPLLKSAITTLGDALTEHRRRTDSDIKELRRAVWGRSSPGFANGHEGEE